MTRAFVTGAGGQDGSYLVERLLADGVEVHVLAHEDDANPTQHGVEQHTGDLTRTDDVRRLLLDVRPELVFNLAALSSVAQSWADPELTHEVNGRAAVGLFEAALALQEQHGVDVRLVQASSAEIFGSPTISPQDESTPLAPVNPYGEAKAHAHRAVAALRAQGLYAVNAILYNHESPRRPATFVTRKITSTVAAIARGHADTLTLGNLDARRDWGWAPDYVDAMLRAAKHPEPQDYVIATGVVHSVRDFVAAAFARVGIDDWEPQVTFDPALVRPVDAASLVGDPSRARADLGWAPTLGFAEIVGRMVEVDLDAEPAPFG